MIKNFRQHAFFLGDWHFHQGCSRWPKANYIEEKNPPDPEEFCLECMLRYTDERPMADRRYLNTEIRRVSLAAQ